MTAFLNIIKHLSRIFLNITKHISRYFLNIICAYLFKNIFILILIVKEYFYFKFYSKTSNIKKIYKNKNNSKNCLMIFVIYENKHLSFSTKNLIRSVKFIDIDLIVVSNDKIKNKDLLFLKKNAYKIIMRENIGQCFGGYKDAILSEDIRLYKKLILANDSMFFFNHKLLSKLISKLININKKFVTINVNHVNFHAQSFFLIFDMTITKKKYFTDFWEKYKVTNIRPLVIKYGEEKLTKILKINNVTPHPFVNVPFVKKNIFKLTNKDINFIRKLSFNNDPVIGREEIFQKTKSALLTLNPTHNSFEILAISCSIPLFKKDLFIRRYYSIKKFISLLKYLRIDPNEIKESIKIIGKRRNYQNYSLFKRILFRIDLIN